MLIRVVHNVLRLVIFYSRQYVTKVTFYTTPRHEDSVKPTPSLKILTSSTMEFSP